jgi:hypothetical protein
MADQHDNARQRERPRPAQKDQTGFFGNRGHAAPTPPGGKNPGGSSADQPRRAHREDYDDYPLDPRPPGRDGNKRGTPREGK